MKNSQVAGFNSWYKKNKLNEGKLRNELVRKAGTRDNYGIATGEDGFDQKGAFDDSQKATQDGLNHMFSKLANDPEAARLFIRKLSKHTSLEDIAQAMHTSLNNPTVHSIQRFGDSEWDINPTSDFDEYGPEEEFDNWEDYDASPYDTSHTNKGLFNTYKEKHGNLKVRKKK